ncbi:MAG: hypothetical protein OXG25_15670 [Gammaproteobacteria bacterium]|nr:hypothetical protein [Gammaproteobacteria bacterium]
MKQIIRTALEQPLYPWLVGISPILHLYKENLGLVIDSEVIPSILLMLLSTSIVFYIINRLVQSMHLTGFITSLCSLVFSLSGHVYVLVFMPKSLGIWTMMVFAGLAYVIFALRKKRSKDFFAKATPSFNVIALALLVLQLAGIVDAWGETSKFVQIYADNIPNSLPGVIAPKAMDSDTKPDIYYIIPDGYPSDAWLRSTENYDNSEFTRALQDRGFTVVGHAQSNYANTILSLPSVLNGQYYHSNPSPYSDYDYLRVEAANSKVARFLSDMGYTYIQLLSGSFLPSPMADIIRDFTPQGTIEIEVDITTISEGILTGDVPNIAEPARIERSYKRSFYEAYMNTTLLRLARSRLGKLLQNALSLPHHTSAPERFLETIDEVVKISAMPEATFTIVHLLKPHRPVVFNEDGEPIPWIHRPNPEEFFAELRFINSRFLHLIDSILERSKHPPVIIFQADHGSVRGMGPAPGRNTLFDIYAAYHLPSQFSVAFPKPFTTVNTFRLVLNSIFGSGYELQTDKLFELPRRYKALFQWLDVTDEFLKTPSLPVH